MVRVLLIFLFLSLALTGCATFPEVEVSDQKFDADTPYPEFVPLDILLKAPEPEIDAETEAELTQRNADLAQTPSGATAQETADPILDRLDALRAKQAEQSAAAPEISDALRARMDAGITAPAIPE